MKDKLYVFWFIVLLSSIALFTGCTNNHQTSADKPIKVGVLLPLTGGAASYGTNSRRGVELAKEHFLSDNGDINLELIVQDSKGDADTGIKAAHKLVDRDNIVACIGDVTSSVTLAVAPLMNERHVPIIATGASSPNISQAGAYVFRTWPSDTLEAQVMANYLAKIGIKKLAILKINNEYGLAMSKAFTGRLSPDIQLVADESFNQGARDMRTQLLRIKESGADALYFIGFPEAAVVLGLSLPTTGLHIKIFATSAFEDPQIPAKTGGILNNTIYTKPTTNTRQFEIFRKAYTEKFNSEPGLTSDTAYDAAMLLFKAIGYLKKSGKPVTGEAILRRLHTVKNYPGASGTLTFDENGDVLKPVGLYILTSGIYKKLDQQ